MHRLSDALRRLSAQLGAVTTFVALPCVTEAQIETPGRFEAGVYGGGSFPLGRFSDSAKAGYHLAGMASTHVNNHVDVRIDVAFNKLSDQTLSEGTTFREVGTNLLLGTVGGEFHFARSGTTVRDANTISPYLLAGVGAYWFRFDYVCRGVGCTGPEREEKSETRWGLNTGAGATVPVRAAKMFFQVAYHAILPKGGSNSAALLLASFGLKFPMSH